jgi:site-specific recombinase XerD
MKTDMICLQPAEKALDAKLLDTLVELWLQHCASKLDSVMTLPGYADKIAYFRHWWQTNGPSLNWRLTRSVLEQFERDLRSTLTKRTKQPLSYNTRFDVIRRLRSMLKWAYETDRIPFNYGIWLPTPVGAPPVREAADLLALQQLMAAAGKTTQAKRNQAILAVLIGAGLRRKEACSLNIEGVIFCVDGTGKAQVFGKRTKRNNTGMRWVGLDAPTCSYLATYIVETGRKRGPLFCNAITDQRLTPQGIYKIVKATIAAADLDTRIDACHDLRRAFAHHFAMLRPGDTYADILRRQLGHAHYAQTAAYTLIGVDDLRTHIISPLTLLQSGD